jgi:hypothetical protein
MKSPDTSKTSSVVRASGAHAREAPVVLARSIKARVNQLAHRSAQWHEEVTRTAMLQSLEGLARAGTDYSGLHSALDDIEQQTAIAAIQHREVSTNE